MQLDSSSLKRILNVSPLAGKEKDLYYSELLYQETNVNAFNTFEQIDCLLSFNNCIHSDSFLLLHEDWHCQKI